MKNLFKTQMGVPTTIMRFDNGKEFIHHRMQSYAKQHGIRVESNTPHTPQQNGVVERCNRTLMEMARTQLNATGVSPMYLLEALRIRRYQLNRMPNTALARHISPF
jgi:transposase InsO family protein